MASISLQPPGVTLPVSRSGEFHQQDFSYQQLHLGNSRAVTDSSTPATPSGQGQCYGEEVFWKGRNLDAFRCHRARQEVLWRQFFLAPRLWWDNRRDKHSARSPDFRHRESGEALWLNSFCKPAWVDGQLAALDRQLGLSPTTSSSDSPKDLGSFGLDVNRIEGTAERLMPSMGCLVRRSNCIRK